MDGVSDDFIKGMQRILRSTDDLISIYDLAKKMNYRVDPLLEKIQLIQQEYKLKYRRDAYKMALQSNEEAKEFFRHPVIDLGMLIQHKIKEINEPLREKLNTMGHNMFYSSWLTLRGY